MTEFNDLTSEEIEALIGRARKQHQEWSQQNVNGDVEHHEAVIHNALAKQDEKQDADMIVVLSSELLCNIVQQYYTRIMPNMKVTVIDAKGGLMEFSLAISEKQA